eukprot:6998152-Pyramimonas_sp.AAC.1
MGRAPCQGLGDYAPSARESGSSRLACHSAAKIDAQGAWNCRAPYQTDAPNATERNHPRTNCARGRGHPATRKEP